MAEALGIVASIAGLASLAVQLTNGCYVCYTYLKSAKQATDQVNGVIDELNDLRQSLQSMGRLYSKRTQSLASSQDVIQRLNECTSEIEEFSNSLYPDFKGLRGKIEQLKWPKKHGKVNTFIAKLRRYREYFDSEKVNDIIALSESAVIVGVNSLAIGTSSLDSTRAIWKYLKEDEEKTQWLKMLEWLSPLDLTNSRIYQDELYTTRRHAKSSTWILRDPGFNVWRHSMPHSPSSILWCKGDPGTGKTIIRYGTSLALNELTIYLNLNLFQLGYNPLSFENEYSTCILLLQSPGNIATAAGTYNRSFAEAAIVGEVLSPQATGRNKRILRAPKGEVNSTVSNTAKNIY